MLCYFKDLIDIHIQPLVAIRWRAHLAVVRAEFRQVIEVALVAAVEALAAAVDADNSKGLFVIMN